MKRISAILIFLNVFSVLAAQEYVKTWVEVGHKTLFYGAYSTLYSLPLASNYDLLGGYSFQWDGNPFGGKETTHAITLQGSAYFPLNETSSKQDCMVFRQKLLFRDMSALGLNEYAAALSVGYLSSRFEGEIALMHRVLQDLTWKGDSFSSRYLHEPFSWLYHLRFHCFDVREHPLWNLSFRLSNQDEFLWERMYFPQLSVTGEYAVSETYRIFAEAAYMAAGIFNMHTDVYKSYIRIGMVCDIK